MSSPCRFHGPLILLLILLIAISHVRAQARTLTSKKLQRAFNNSISALFVFGDSTVDSGNNNYINTILKSDFPPYGRDFVNHIPTGRFTNGCLITDYLVGYVGIKEFVPPYLDPTLSLDELMTGVCFASGGSGFDPLTAQITGVIPLQKQLEYFREYKKRVENAIGKKKTKLLIRKAAFLISAGTNDFVLNYISTPIRRQTYTVSAYQQFILQIVQQFIQSLIGEGARLIGIVGVPPLGCLPVVITMNSSNPIQPRECIESYSTHGREYNWLLQNLLKKMQTHRTKLVYADIYNPLNDMIQNPSNFGFDEVSIGCCGSGRFELTIFCNPKSSVCNNSSKYIFWDAVHPTQATYYNLFQALRATIDSVIKQ